MTETEPVLDSHSSEVQVNANAALSLLDVSDAKYLLTC